MLKTSPAAHPLKTYFVSGRRLGSLTPSTRVGANNSTVGFAFASASTSSNVPTLIIKTRKAWAVSLHCRTTVATEVARDSVTAISSLGDWFGVSREHLEVVFLDDHVGAVSAPAAIKAVTKRLRIE